MLRWRYTGPFIFLIQCPAAERSTGSFLTSSLDGNYVLGNARMRSTPPVRTEFAQLLPFEAVLVKCGWDWDGWGVFCTNDIGAPFWRWRFERQFHCALLWLLFLVPPRNQCEQGFSSWLIYMYVFCLHFVRLRIVICCLYNYLPSLFLSPRACAVNVNLKKIKSARSMKRHYFTKHRI